MKSLFEEEKEYEAPRIVLMSVSDLDVIATSGNEGEDDGEDNGYMGEWDPF